MGGSVTQVRDYNENKDFSARIGRADACAKQTMFPVKEILPNEILRGEPMGSKRKFWWLDETGQAWLFKFARPQTGEDWAEKLACELAAVLDMPHAQVELATCVGQRGLLSRQITKPGDRLVHGNELLMDLDAEYSQLADPGKQPYRQSKHTLGAVQRALTGLLVPDSFLENPEFRSAYDVFVGYLLLDAWIANTDRHHENWAVIERVDANGSIIRRLAATFDHASSLGAQLTDAERVRRLTTKDRGESLSQYVERGRSAIYALDGDKKPLGLLDGFVKSAKHAMSAGRNWLACLERIEPCIWSELIDQFPKAIMSENAARFSREMLRLNRDRLLRSLS